MRVAIMYPDLVRIITMFSRLLSNFFPVFVDDQASFDQTSWDVNKHFRLPIINVIERTSRQIARSKQLNELKRRHRHALSSWTVLVRQLTDTHCRPGTSLYATVYSGRTAVWDVIWRRRKRQPTSADVPVQFANSVYINFRLLRHLRLPKNC